MVIAKALSHLTFTEALKQLNVLRKYKNLEDFTRFFTSKQKCLKHLQRLVLQRKPKFKETKFLLENFMNKTLQRILQLAAVKLQFSLS